jgi:predicted dehydrogenase/GNAT superfamily N-acetyltransferase
MRIGFLGAGLIATYHSKMLRKSGLDIERAGVYDPDSERMHAFAQASGHRAYSSEDDVLDSCDAVYICTWTSEHPRLVAAAAQRGLHIFCEKPLATTLADAEQMAAVVAQAGITHQVGLVLRHSPAYIAARSLIDSPGAGRVMAVVLRDDQFIPIQGHYGSTWRGDRSRAGAGTLLEHSIHDIDMLAYLVGEPIERVSAHQANFHLIDGIEDVVSTTARFESGATATLTSVWHDNLARPSLRRVEVFCERRHVVIGGDDWFGPVEWTDTDGSAGQLSGEEIVAEAERLTGVSSNPDREFVLAASADLPAFPDFQTALQAHRVVDAIYRSAAADSMPFTVANADKPSVAPTVDIVEIPTRATTALRMRVLRRGTPSQDSHYAQDDAPGTVHLGALYDGRLVGVSTWAVEEYPGRRGGAAVRLRGMAVEDGLQGSGIGASLVATGVERALHSGATLVWASARDAVLGFYERQGFEVVGDGYIDVATALPHHDIIRTIG